MQTNDPKLLTVEEIFCEIIPNKYNIVWIESPHSFRSGYSDFRNFAHITVQKFRNENDGPVVVGGFFIGNDYEIWLYLRDYGRSWRAWTKRPSEAQAKSIPWGTNSKEKGD